MVLDVDNAIALDAVPLKVPVIVPVEKPPLTSLFTIVLGVLSDVAEFTDDATVVIVDELTPPTLFTVVGTCPIPKPITSPYNSTCWVEASDWPPPITISFRTVNLAEFVVPPLILKPFVKVSGLKPLMVLFVSVSVPLNVAIVPLVGSVTLVFPVVVMVVV